MGKEKPTWDVNAPVEGFKKNFEGIESKAFDELKKINADKLARDAKSALDTQLYKQRMAGNLSDGMIAAAEGAKAEIDTALKTFKKKLALLRYTAEVKVLDVEKDKHIDLDSYVYDPSKGTEATAKKQALTSLKRRYKGLKKPAILSDADIGALNVAGSITRVEEWVRVIDSAAFNYFSKKTSEIDTKREGVKYSIDRINPPEKEEGLSETERVRDNNLYFSQLSASHTEMIGIKAEYTALMQSIDADTLVPAAKKVTLRKLIREKTALVDTKIAASIKKIEALGKDTDGISSDYLQEKMDAQKAVTEHLRQESGRAHQALAVATKVVYDRLVKAGKSPDEAKKAAARSVDPKLHRAARAAFARFREQQVFTAALEKVKGNKTVVPKNPNTAYRATSKEIYQNKDVTDADPRKMKPPLKKGTPEYEAAWNIYLDKWYGWAANNEKAPYPPKTKGEKEADTQAAEKVAISKKEEAQKAKEKVVDALPLFSMTSDEKNRITNRGGTVSFVYTFEGQHYIERVVVQKKGINTFIVDGQKITTGDFRKTLYPVIERKANEKRRVRLLGKEAKLPKNNS